MRILQSKAVFERCVSKLVRKDIDLYQTGFVTYNNMAYGAAVWEESESELHKVKFSSLKEGDGRYYFTDQIRKFIRELIKAYKMGEPIEGSSS